VHQLVYYEVFETRSAAFHRERAMKKWRRLWKLRLIERFNPGWRDLGDSLPMEWAGIPLTRSSPRRRGPRLFSLLRIVRKRRVQLFHRNTKHLGPRLRGEERIVRGACARGRCPYAIARFSISSAAAANAVMLAARSLSPVSSVNAISTGPETAMQV
jgi:hypothetical protein